MIDNNSQTFPQLAINVSPDGAVVSLVLAPGFVISQALTEDIMNQITAKWLETRKEIKNRLQIVRDIETSKIRGLK